MTKGYLPALAAGAISVLAGWFLLPAQETQTQPAQPTPVAQPNPGTIEKGQTLNESRRRSSGCVSCHGLTDSPSMHTTGTVQLACIDCHGGKGDIQKPASADPKSSEYEKAKREAHPQPHTNLFAARGAANPIRPYAEWLKEDREYIKFVNPGDLPPRRSRDLRQLPRQRNPSRTNQHDDPRRNAVAGRSLQQRRLPL